MKSIITGRRSSQGAARAALQPLEIDATGLYKLNPFVSWTFGQVKAYVDEHNVPRNALLDQGYKSVGDWHSTQKSGEGDAGERAGRWQGKNKTECGLHKDYFKMKLAAKKKVCFLFLFVYGDPFTDSNSSFRLVRMSYKSAMKLARGEHRSRPLFRIVQPLPLPSAIFYNSKIFLDRDVM